MSGGKVIGGGMRVLGIDPGTLRTGWGIVEREGRRLVGRDAGVLRASERLPLEERLRIVHDGLVALIAREKPTAMAVEEIFFAKHPTAALKLGHVRGVVLLVAAQAGLPVAAYPPAVVKKTVGGGGQAPKAQVAQMVGAILGWRELPAIDATDALAVAITHAQAIRTTVALPRAPRRTLKA